MTPHQQMLSMATAYWTSQAIHVAAQLGVADHLQEGPRGVDELAELVDAHPQSLYRMLRALASQGIFAEGEARQFGLTPLAELLCENHPSRFRAAARMMGDEHYEAWGALAYSVRSGGCAFERVYGEGVFDYLARHPDKAAVFDAAMTGIHGEETAAMLSAYDFSGIGTLADIGGGNGSLLTQVLRQYPGMRGILYDLPHVIERARPRLEAAGVADRCRVEAGSFFEHVPPGADAYLMRHIIHDWTDEQCRTILSHCRRAMTPDARLLVLEAVIPPGNEPSWSKLLDLNMLVMPGGQERTADEYAALLASAGLRLARIIPTRTEISVVEVVGSESTHPLLLSNPCSLFPDP